MEISRYDLERGWILELTRRILQTLCLTGMCGIRLFGVSRPKDDDGEDGRLESHAHVVR